MPFLKAIRALMPTRQLQRDLVRRLRLITERGDAQWMADQLNNWPGYNFLLDGFMWECDTFTYRVAICRGEPILGVFHESQRPYRGRPQPLFTLSNRSRNYLGMTLLLKELQEWPFLGSPTYEDRKELQRLVFGICSPALKRELQPRFFLLPAT